MKKFKLLGFRMKKFKLLGLPYLVFMLKFELLFFGSGCWGREENFTKLEPK